MQEILQFIMEHCVLITAIAQISMVWFLLAVCIIGETYFHRRYLILSFVLCGPIGLMFLIFIMMLSGVFAIIAFDMDTRKKYTRGMSDE